ncbi:MAG: efflux RND transporter periplasmic adaptor subunit, partial [Geobacteraceae bacterium]
ASRAVESSRAAGAVAGYTRITAPLTGIVTVKAVDLGMSVFPGMPLMTVEEEGNYRLEVAAPDSLSGKIKQGITVLVKIDGLAEGLTGQVVAVAPTSDPSSRTFTVKLGVADKGVRSGMYGKALFPVGERQGLFVPKSAVMDRGTLTAIWVVDRENIARLRLVKTGKTISDRVEVLAGLIAGERIVTGGSEKVVDGARVE